MCGRFSQYPDPHPYRGYLGVTSTVTAEGDGAREVRPADQAWVCRQQPTGERHFFRQRWGLVPSWSKGPDPRFTMFNARAETVRQKPAFWEPFCSRRCVVPAEAFFEWRREGGFKQPYAIHRADGAPLVFAGLWDRWKDAQGAALDSFTILTTEPNPVMATLHDRMPAILQAGELDLWLDVRADRQAVHALLRPYPLDDLVLEPVTPGDFRPDLFGG